MPAARTQDSKVFSFLPGDAPCVGLDTVCSTYRQLVPTVKLAGPTSFAPAILQAMKVRGAGFYLQGAPGLHDWGYCAQRRSIKHMF